MTPMEQNDGEAPADISFGPFRLDVLGKALYRDGERLEIQSRPLKVLAHLAQRPGQIVDKRELLEQVWRGTFVSRTTLRVCVRNVRDALGERADAPVYLETVGRQGYRFLGSVEHRQGSTAPIRPAASLRSHLVAREADLEQLQRSVERSNAGARQTVFVSGPAGIGKTSLVGAFVAEVRRRGEARVAEGQCTEQLGEGEPYRPVLEALARLCRAEDRVIDILRRYAPSWLAQLPGVLDESGTASVERRAAATTQNRMLREMAEATEALSAARPLLIVLEDVHWSDVSTLELVSYLARRPEAARLCIIASYRPTDAIVHGHPLRDVTRDLVARGLAQEIVLELLSENAVARYLSNVLGSTASAERMAHYVHDRSQGNALFMVEIVDHLLRQGLVASADGHWLVDEQASDVVPDNLRLLIERQLERLDADHQSILETSAVAGRTFSAAVVSSALRREVEEVEDAYEELAASGLFVEEEEIEEWPDGTLSGRYRFLHALHQNVLSARVAAARRVRLHREIGMCLERAYGERTREIAASLALHFEEGHDGERASRYHDAAGVAALSRDAHHEASAHFERGLNLLMKTPETAQRDRTELVLQFRHSSSLTALHGYASPEAERSFARQTELCERLDDPAHTAVTLLPRRAYHLIRGELAEAEALSRRFHELAIGDRFLLSWSHYSLGEDAYFRGCPTEAREHLEESQRLHDPELYGPGGPMRGMNDAGVMSSGTLAIVLWLLGRPADADQMQTRALGDASSGGDPYTLAGAHATAAMHHYLRGEARASAEQAEATLAICGEYSFQYWATLAACLRAWAGVRLAESEAHARLERALADYDATGSSLARPLQLGFLAESHLRRNEIDLGLEAIDRALAQTNRSDTHWVDAQLHTLRAELHAAAKEPSRAAASYLEAIEVAKARSAASLELRASLGLHQLQPGDRSRELLGEAVRRFAEDADTPELTAARGLLGE
jgi:DNA-binding winged helix-turn-helix (wHTH) protein